jgi:hypothetical protein
MEDNINMGLQAFVVKEGSELNELKKMSNNRFLYTY